MEGARAYPQCELRNKTVRQSGGSCTRGDGGWQTPQKDLDRSPRLQCGMAALVASITEIPSQCTPQANAHPFPTKTTHF